MHWKEAYKEMIKRRLDRHIRLCPVCSYKGAPLEMDEPDDNGRCDNYVMLMGLGLLVAQLAE